FRPSEQKPEPDFDYRWNKGSDTDRKYTFGEFQVRIAKKNWHRFFESEKAKYNSLRAPWSDGNSERPTIHEVATRIFNLGFRQPVHVLDLDSTLGLERFAEEPFRELQDPSLWDREDPWKTDFHYYFENLEAEFQHVFRSYSRSQPQAQARAQAPASWRDVVVGSSQVSWRDVVVGSSQVVAEDSAKRAAKLAILKKNHELGMELVEVILTLRIEAHKRHFFKQLSGKKYDGSYILKKLNLAVDIIQAEHNTKSQVPDGRGYPEVDIERTMNNAWNDAETQERLRGKGFTSEKDLVKWARNLGNPDVDVKYGYSDDNMKHFRNLKSWAWMLAMAKSPEDINIKEFNIPRLARGTAAAAPNDGRLHVVVVAAAHRYFVLGANPEPVDRDRRQALHAALDEATRYTFRETREWSFDEITQDHPDDHPSPTSDEVSRALWAGGSDSDDGSDDATPAATTRTATPIGTGKSRSKGTRSIFQTIFNKFAKTGKRFGFVPNTKLPDPPSPLRSHEPLLLLLLLLLPTDCYVSRRRANLAGPRCTADLHVVLQHQIISELFDGRLHLAPVVKPRAALDVGTGPGLWALMNPNCAVVGIDIEKVRPPYPAPPNCQFKLMDATADWAPQLGSKQLFDYIHVRMLGDIIDKERFIRSIYDQLSPGGWVEFTEWIPVLQSPDRSLDGTAFRRWNDLLGQGLENMGRDIRYVREYRPLLDKAGFERLKLTKHAAPTNSCYPGKKCQRFGAMMVSNWNAIIEPLSVPIFTIGLGWSEAQVQALLKKVRREIEDTRYHSFMTLLTVYCRKPRSDHTSTSTSLTSSLRSGQVSVSQLSVSNLSPQEEEDEV
ncbi:hypothetical protein CTA1_3953, partial [Colletotrichum tanaceti]